MHGGNCEKVFENADSFSIEKGYGNNKKHKIEGNDLEKLPKRDIDFLQLPKTSRLRTEEQF